MNTRTRKQLLAPATAAAVALVPAAAFAHGKLESAVPASGSTVDAAPDAPRLTFNENLESTFSTVKVSDTNGAAVSKEKAKVDAANPRVLTVVLSFIQNGKSIRFSPAIWPALADVALACSNGGHPVRRRLQPAGMGGLEPPACHQYGIL